MFAKNEIWVLVDLSDPSADTVGRETSEGEVLVNCFVCRTKGATESAVAVCQHCSVGLCESHLAEAQKPGPGGMRYTCAHELPSAVPEKAQ